MEALVISIVIYMFLVMIGFSTYLLFSYLKRPKTTILKMKTIKVNSNRVLSNTEKVAQLALSYKNGLISQSEFEANKNQLLG